MSTRRSSLRRREKPPFQRFKDHFRKFTAFMFSNVGIILLVILYTIGGAFIFQAIEVDHAKLHHQIDSTLLLNGEKDFTNFTIGNIWDEVSWNISFYDRNTFNERLNDILLNFQRSVVNREKFKAIETDAKERWSFPAAFLYALTVITTIGYGNITPHSDWGKLATILYAIIGMPLFLLYLSNIGDVLAKSFKWIYSKVCLCRICPGVARRRLIRDRLKIKEIALSKALADMESARQSKYTSSSSTSDSGSSSNSYDSETSSSSSRRSRTTRRTSGAVSRLNEALDLFEDDEVSEIEREIRQNTDEITVPLSVCILIMISYIVGGAILFKHWEKDWRYLDGSYFCFISLSSIGFGDLVPGKRMLNNKDTTVELSFILCAVYLLLGMALIAMCFNLMQEQVIHNMRSIKRAFKALCRCRKEN